ncbi:hypothetical protein MAR_035024, partial [Mya arenaria]
NTLTAIKRHRDLLVLNCPMRKETTKRIMGDSTFHGGFVEMFCFQDNCIVEFMFNVKVKYSA